jgi:hypothetical protein
MQQSWEIFVSANTNIMVLRTFDLQDNYTSATSFVLRTFGAYCNAAELQDIRIC